jgi:hypothetical protein
VDSKPEKTIKAVLNEIFPECPDQHDTIVWELTGFPNFWPDPNTSGEQQFRNQLAEVGKKLDAGISIEQQQAEVYRTIDEEMNKMRAMGLVVEEAAEEAEEEQA